MPKEILLPALTADFEGGIIEEWHKAAGDSVEIGDVLAEISTDKAVIELEAEDAGTLGKILVEAGADEVPVDTPIAILLLDGETMDDLDAKAGEQAAAQDSKTPDSQPGTVDIAAAQTEVVDVDVSSGDRVMASPVAVRIANQLGLDLSTVEGSGPGGRIVLGDVEAAAALQDLSTTAVSQPPPTKPVELPPPGSYTEVPVDNVRRIIARRLGEAKREIPHFYLTIDCEIDELLGARAEANASTDDSTKISVNDFMIKACALALREVPGANAAWTENAILRFNDVNIAVAVATDKGLVTPVINQADTKDLGTIAAEVKALAARAREGRLKPEEYKGGGFTVSNLGMYGVREFSAIINPPQACILAIGAGEQRPVVRNGGIVAATVMSCTLSVDHRAVDGALGATFLQSLKSFVEQPKRLLG